MNRMIHTIACLKRSDNSNFFFVPVIFRVVIVFMMTIFIFYLTAVFFNKPVSKVF